MNTSIRTFFAVALAATALGLPSIAAAQDAAADGKPARREGGGLLAGAKVGGVVPFGGLNPNLQGGIEVGYVFPWMHRAFAAAIDLDYAVPKKSGTETDPRVAGGKYSWHLTEQQLELMPVVMYRITSLGKITPFIGVGPRIYFLQSTVRSDDSGPKILETTEKSTKVGVGVPFGVEYALGPGALLAEMLFQYGPLDHRATGSANTGALSLGLGYRFLL